MKYRIDERCMNEPGANLVRGLYSLDDAKIYAQTWFKTHVYGNTILQAVLFHVADDNKSVDVYLGGYGQSKCVARISEDA